MTPLVASNVPTRFSVLTLLELRSRRMTVTVSPTSIAPLGGAKLSAVRVAPAAAMLTPAGATCVVTVALLLAGFGSGSELLIVPEAVSVPLVVVWTTIVSVALAPAFIVPRYQVSAVPEMETTPCAVLVEITLTPAGSEPLKATLEAALGPEFVTEIT